MAGSPHRNYLDTTLGPLSFSMRFVSEIILIRADSYPYPAGGLHLDCWPRQTNVSHGSSFGEAPVGAWLHQPFRCMSIALAHVKTMSARVHARPTMSSLSVPYPCWPGRDPNGLGVSQGGSLRCIMLRSI